MPASGWHGRWRRLAAALLLAAFYGLPWLRWNGHPAVLLDLSARRFDLFGVRLYPDDAALVICMILCVIVTLGLISTVFGRIWCGYGCPQSILSRVYRAIERRTTFKGRAARAGLVLRHLSWAGISLWTGFTFVAFFAPLIERLHGSDAFACNGWEGFWIAFYAITTWINVVYLREQVCRYLCPYARLQPLLSDHETPRIGYDARRGEPRGPRPPGNGSVMQRARGLLDSGTANDYVFRAAHPALAGAMPVFGVEHLGDCTDCGLCVQACPMQLDIRNGSNPHCLHCGACVDACSQAMGALHFPRGLIRSRNALDQHPRKLLRPKVLSQAGVLIVLLLCMAWLGLRSHGG